MRPVATGAAVLAAIVLVTAGCGGSSDGGGSEGVKSTFAKVETNEGTFTILLDTDGSPQTTDSFIKLAKEHFFDDTIFHRIVPGFVIQGGDPTGSGRGGPGYTTVEPPPPNTQYIHGTVAMAKGATDPPGTAGSQFFIVTGKNANLPPEYALLGQVDQGIEVVDKIGKLGNPRNEKPTERVVIEHLTIEQH
jgi:peptidyl-prolyl cis-trans isomerase B (cyclophilin B)